MEYIFIIERANDGTFSGYVPDLPGCTPCGDTVEELQNNMLEAVAGYIEALRETGQHVPAPSIQTGVVRAT